MPASLPTQSIANASFGIYLKFTGTTGELLSALISPRDRDQPAAGAAATKSIILGVIISATACCSYLRIDHPVWMACNFVLTAVTFSLVGFIIGSGPTASRSRKLCRC